MMKMILKILFISDFSLSMLNSKNTKHLKKKLNEELNEDGVVFAWQKMRKRK